MYLLAEPLFRLPWIGRRYWVPVGQLDSCARVLNNTKDPETAEAKIHEEYFAIVAAMIQMGVDFRVLRSQLPYLDMASIRILKDLGCEFVDVVPGTFGESVFFPREFCARVNGSYFVNERTAPLCRKEESRVIRSAFGDSTRMLLCGDAALVSDRMLIGDQYRSLGPGDLEIFSDTGIRVGLFHSYVGEELIHGFRCGSYFTNDHINRVAALLRGKDGGLHLIIHPWMEGACYRNGNGNWETVKPKVLQNKTREWYKDWITVHVPEVLRVPYSLSLHQFPDGRVLMTAGEDELLEMVMAIVGGENVVTTAIPIERYPTFGFLGLSDLINEYPSFFLE